MSSVFLSSSAEVAALIADIAQKVGIVEHAGLVAIKTYLDSLTETAPPAPSPVSTPVKKAVAEAPGAPKKRKVSTVPVAAATTTVIEPTADDPLRNHKYRLQSFNPAFCMGRKVDLKNQIVGTRKDDASSNGIFWPEKQCTKAPEAGEKLCRFCKEKDDDVKSGKTADKHWFGRLDEPIYFKACVVGCGDFFAKYPEGIPGDATTAPPAGFVVKTPDGVIAAKKRGPKPKAAAPATTAPAKAPAAAPAKAPAKKAPAKKVSIAKTADAPIEAEWIVLMYEGRVVARNTKNNYVYEIDADIVDDGADISKLVKKNDYIGVWKSGAVDAYDLSGAAAEDTDSSDSSDSDSDE
jgi:hypothetical protein